MDNLMNNSKTALYEKHVENNGNIVSFAGYLLPTHYSGIKNEHSAVRKFAGLFDVSHMGQIIVSGVGSHQFLNRLTTNNLDTLSTGQIQYTVMCNKFGGIIDDLLIYKQKENYLLVVNASNKSIVLNWLKNNIIEKVIINDLSDKAGLLALQGPKSREILKQIINVDIKSLKYYNFLNCQIDGFEVMISRTGYTGELGFEIFSENINIINIWDIIIKAGTSYGLLPAGLGCRDTLRMEVKYCLHGNDIDNKTNPIEAGLGWITKFDQEDFIGKESCIEVKNNIKKKLICFEMLSKAIPRNSCMLYVGEKKVGYVTSGTMSPSIGKGIGLGYVEVEYTTVDQILIVDIRGRKKEAIIVKPPFYKRGSIHN